jgi:hypothetical protein
VQDLARPKIKRPAFWYFSLNIFKIYQAGFIKFPYLLHAQINSGWLKLGFAQIISYALQLEDFLSADYHKHNLAANNKKSKALGKFLGNKPMPIKTTYA